MAVNNTLGTFGKYSSSMGAHSYSKPQHGVRESSSQHRQQGTGNVVSHQRDLQLAAIFERSQIGKTNPAIHSLIYSNSLKNETKLFLTNWKSLLGNATNSFLREANQLVSQNANWATRDGLNGLQNQFSKWVSDVQDDLDSRARQLPEPLRYAFEKITDEHLNSVKDRVSAALEELSEHFGWNRHSDHNNSGNGNLPNGNSRLEHDRDRYDHDDDWHRPGRGRDRHDHDDDWHRPGHGRDRHDHDDDWHRPGRGRDRHDHGGTPPGHGGTPPGHGGTPPGHGGTPPGHGGTPPGHGGTPPGHGGTPPGHGGTPPGHGGTPPGHGGTPPGHGGTPPGHGGTPPGHGGTPPGHGGGTNPPGDGGGTNPPGDGGGTNPPGDGGGTNPPGDGGGTNPPGNGGGTNPPGDGGGTNPPGDGGGTNPPGNGGGTNPPGNGGGTNPPGNGGGTNPPGNGGGTTPPGNGGGTDFALRVDIGEGNRRVTLALRTPTAAIRDKVLFYVVDHMGNRKAFTLTFSDKRIENEFMKKFKKSKYYGETITLEKFNRFLNELKRSLKDLTAAEWDRIKNKLNGSDGFSIMDQLMENFLTVLKRMNA